MTTRRQHRTKTVRRLAQLVAIPFAVVELGTVSFAPEGGVVAPVVVTRASTAPDPAADPPGLADLDGVPPPRVRALAAVIYNPSTHEIVWEANGHTPRPIASITKVMTSLVFLESDPDLTLDVVVSARDVRRASTTYLRHGERVTLNDVLHLALVASDNVAARVLARVSGWGTDGFIARMNRKAQELGLRDTHFSEPSGLSRRNVSTAYDVSRLITRAAEHPTIAAIMRTSAHRLRTDRRVVTVRNTNHLLRGGLTVLGGKTGYIDAAGYCLAAVIQIAESEPLSIVVLGVGSNQGRFSDVTRLVDWAATEGRALLVSDPRAAN